MLSCILGNNRINCFDSSYSKEELKKWSNKNILLCPACKKPYEYCHGRIKTPYFRHKDKILCEDKYSEAETEEHIKGKQDLFEWISKQDNVTDVILEGWLPDTKQRPDIMFKYKGRQCVIEYQCTPISTEYYERHELYKASGINDIWICGTEKYFQFYHRGNGCKKITEIEDACKIYYDSKNKMIYKLNESGNFFINKKSYNMRNPYDYKIGYSNYFQIKDISVNYKNDYYYPTGRKSNKHPYPVSKATYIGNRSRARCISLKTLKLRGIKWENMD